MSAIRKTEENSYLRGKIEEVVGLICKEEFKGTASQVVASQMDLLQLREAPLEVDALAFAVTQAGVPKTDSGAGHFETTLDHGHQRH